MVEGGALQQPYVSASLRRFVAKRAGHRCEYCLLPEWAAIHRHEPDHIIAIQHGGTSEEANLALACMRCNRYKGSNLASIDSITKEIVRLFNPRTDVWTEHFELRGAEISPLTSIGRVTVKFLRFNDENRLRERELLIKKGLF